MYENKIENYDFCHKLSNRFAEEFDNVAQKGKIKLATGNTVCYKFASINALFIEFDDLSAWGRFSSIEDIDFNNVKRIVLPISVAEFKKKEKGLWYSRTTARHHVIPTIMLVTWHLYNWQRI